MNTSKGQYGKTGRFAFFTLAFAVFSFALLACGGEFVSENLDLQLTISLEGEERVVKIDLGEEPSAADLLLALLATSELDLFDPPIIAKHLSSLNNAQRHVEGIYSPSHLALGSRGEVFSPGTTPEPAPDSEPRSQDSRNDAGYGVSYDAGETDKSGSTSSSGESAVVLVFPDVEVWTEKEER